MSESRPVESITIGRFKLVRWNDGVRISHDSGERQGEGGMFREAELEAAIAAFYAEKF